MNADQVRDVLRDAIARVGSQKAFADQLQVTPAFISNVLRGTKEPSRSMLQRLGITRVISYVANPVHAVPYPVRVLPQFVMQGVRLQPAHDDAELIAAVAYAMTISATNEVLLQQAVIDIVPGLKLHRPAPTGTKTSTLED